MSDPLKKFLDTAHDNDVDDTLLKSSFVKKNLHKLENFGKDLEEKVKNWGKDKTPPMQPSGPTPTYQESAFVNRSEETTLYNVTNRENAVPVVTRISKVFKKTSYSVRGFNVAATYKNEDERYSLLAGEKVGFKYQKKTGMFNSSVNLEHKVSNHKTSLTYSASSPENTYSVSLYNQNDNNGLTASFSKSNGFNSAFSVDKNSASLNVGYRKDNVELGAYATTGNNYSNPFVGVTGRITM